MDFDTLRSRIASRSIMSVKEVFRDVLLLTNNALVFYSKNTREYKSALLLRDFTTKILRQHFDDSSSKALSANLSPKTTMYNPPVKPRSIRHGNRKLSGKAATPENAVKKTSNAASGKKPSDANTTQVVESLAMKKKGFGRPKKVGRKNKSQQSQTPTKGRKRGRTR